MVLLLLPLKGWGVIVILLQDVTVILLSNRGLEKEGGDPPLTPVVKSVYG